MATRGAGAAVPAAPAVKREAEQDWGQGEMAINYRTHFTYRIDLWDADGENVIEHLAGVEDPQVAMATYVAACEWHSHKPSPATVFDYSRALAQGDWCLGPALARGHVGRHRDLRVLDTSQVLYDVLAIGIP